MKKFFLSCICLGLVLGISGCSHFNDGTGSFSLPDSKEEPTADASKTRVYMDEIAGVLMNFNGSLLTVNTFDKTPYTFDVSGATLECADGMITGNEISVIYEGRLSDTDTSAVRALKVVDYYHKKENLKERTAYGKVTNLTPNTISITTDDKKTATYPITGAVQYYAKGIKKGASVYIHFKGKFPPANEETPNALDASHLKVLSVSDTEPLKASKPASASKEDKKLRAVIKNINANILQVTPEGSDTVLNVDISKLPCYFRGGVTPGAAVVLYHKGEFNGASLEGMELIYLVGEDPKKLKPRDVTHTVTGTIIGSTGNTITLQTEDGALFTCLTQNAQNASTGGLAVGCGVSVVFNPADSSESNLYQALRITDV